MVLGAVVGEEEGGPVNEVEADAEGAGDAGGRFLAPEQVADADVVGGSWGSMA